MDTIRLIFSTVHGSTRFSCSEASRGGRRVALARRAVRRWLAVDGYPPDLAVVGRVLAVANGEAVATEVGGGRRVRRSHGRLLLEPTGSTRIG